MVLRSGSRNLNGIFDTCNLFGWFFDGSPPAAAAAATAAIAAALVADEVCGGITEETILDAIRAVGVAAVVCVGALPVLVIDMIPPFEKTAIEPPTTSGSFIGLLVTFSQFRELTLPFSWPLLICAFVLFDCCALPSESVWTCKRRKKPI